MNWQSSRNQQLVKAMMVLKTPDEVRNFLRDLLTEKEIDEFAKRFQAAEMLNQKSSYSEIVQVTGLSSTTVARVSKFLQGEFGGYALALKRLAHHTSARLGRGLP